MCPTRTAGEKGRVGGGGPFGMMYSGLGAEQAADAVSAAPVVKSERARRMWPPRWRKDERGNRVHKRDTHEALASRLHGRQSRGAAAHRVMNSAAWRSARRASGTSPSSI